MIKFCFSIQFIQNQNILFYPNIHNVFIKKKKKKLTLERIPSEKKGESVDMMIIRSNDLCLMCECCRHQKWVSKFMC